MLRAVCLAVMLSTLVSSQDKKPEVHINHAFIVPDAETYEAIRNSDFVKRLAVWEERTTHRNDITYAGFYLYGRHTYFEFLKPDERTPVGTSKIAFGVDRTGELDLLQKRAEAAGIKTEIKTITRAFNGKDVDWFRSLDKKDQDAPGLGIWTLEYVPTFLSEWNPAPNGKPGVRREDVLDRYAKLVKQNPAEKWMADVKTIYERLPENVMRRSANECKFLGFKVEEGGPVICKEDQTAIFIWQAPDPGISCVEFQLREKLPNSDHQIGKTRLMIRGQVAYWEFHSERYSWESEVLS